MAQHRDDFDNLEQFNFPYCFRPIYYFARVGGQMPFTITYPIYGGIVRAKFCKRDFIWFTISLGIHIYYIFMAIEMFKSYQNLNTILVDYGQLIIWFLSLLIGICTMILDACNRFKIVKIFNKFTIFDKEVDAKTNKSKKIDSIYAIQ